VKVLVLGGGQIGAAVLKATPKQHEVIGLARAQLDITDSKAVAKSLAESRADWVINAAAYTAVDRAEDEPQVAAAVNDTAVAVFAAGAARENSRLLHLSTDFVFDGTSGLPYSPRDATKPLSIYGATKLAGEHHVLAASSGIVLRTSWVYASAGKNFVLTMLKLMNERAQVSVVCDQIGSPTWAVSAAAAIWGLIEAAAEGGLYHWTDLGVASWYDFAVAIQEEALERGLLTRAATVLPIPSTAYPARAERPSFSVLDTTHTRSVVKTPAQHWRHNLRKMLDELLDAG
jgi:dTDP-4-dehydrorhamnose reductase